MLFTFLCLARGDVLGRDLVWLEGRECRAQSLFRQLNAFSS